MPKEYEGLEDFLIQSFTPGELYKKLIDCKKEELFFEIINKAEEELKTDFIEGYWTDHWTYNLDLIEKYLMVYPEDEENLLFRDNSYTFTIGREVVLPARKRYVETVKGIRQYHFLEKNLSSEVNELLKNKNGEIVTCTLIEKLILLTILKFASLDMYGMGIEMEGGKPGWYDALNGLPGLLGSSMAETYELERQLEYIIKLFEKRERGILLVSLFHSFALLLHPSVLP